MKDVRELITPGAVYADDAGPFGSALDALTSLDGLGPLRGRGRPVPGLFGQSITNLAAVRPTIYCNVPAGYAQLAPAVTTANFPFTDARCIGAPLPGAEVKLVPDAGGGTFVRVGAARTALLSAVPVLADAVIAGENRGFVTALAWLNAAEAKNIAGELPAPAPGQDLVVHDGLHTAIAQALTRHNANAGSAGTTARLAILSEPASLDAGEITDKGYVNQRKVLARRARLVEQLYADPVPEGVIVPS